MHALEPARETIHHVNQLLRRLRQYQTEGEWVSAVLDGASHFVSHVAVFAIEGDALRLRGQAGLSIPENMAFSISSAGAFRAAVASKDPVIALRTPAEVTERLSAPEAGARAHIIPILNGSRVVAVLFAANQDQTDLNAIELITGIASIVLERKSNESLHAQIASQQSASTRFG